ncbi:MAG: EAL domain-containing protein [Rhodospirillaceae bacterium]
MDRASAEGLWTWDLAGGRIQFSPRFLALVGLDPGRTGHQAEDWLSRVHPEDLIWLLACFDGQEEIPGRPFHLEHRLRDEASGWRWLACRGVATLGDDGKPVRIAGTVADISEMKVAEQRLRLAEERYTLAAAAASDGLYDWDLTTGKIDYSPRWKAILGFSPREIGDSPEEWLGRVLAEDLIWLQATLDEQVRPSGAPMQSFQIEYRIRDAGGRVRWMVCRGMTVRDDDGIAVRMIGSQADITERKAAEQQLRQSEERYALAARGAHDGLWDWRFDTGETYLSPRCMEMLGYGEMPLDNRLDDWYRLVVPADRLGLKTALRQHLRGETVHLQHELRMCRADGAVVWCLIRGMAVRDGDGHPVRVAGSVTDITSRKKAEVRLQYNAFHDGLTGLPNRSLLVDRIGQALSRLGSGGRHFAVMLLDLDRFKTVNDSLGTGMGDLVLTTTAARLLRQRRAGDTLARLSADEFGLLIEDIDDPSAALVDSQRASEAVARPFHFENRDVVLTASIGIALSISGYERAEDMLRDASLAMARAKSAGRARVEVFDNRLRDRALSQAQTESELRRALDEGQLRLYYQPIIELETGCIAGVEALIRWQHPDRGLVAPLDFIPLAEESGLIVPIGRWVMETAAAKLMMWRRQFPGNDHLFASVNVSTHQLRDDDLLALVERVLRKTGIPPAALKLEITESVMMFEQNEAEPVMRAIQAAGVQFSIDDFGTGYSSLSYLHRVPAETLKIDKSFVQAIGDGQEQAAIVELIAKLADLLGMQVVAEGIETEVEERFLRALGCKYGQGYRYARPLPPERLTDLLTPGLVLSPR